MMKFLFCCIFLISSSFALEKFTLDEAVKEDDQNRRSSYQVPFNYYEVQNEEKIEDLNEVSSFFENLHPVKKFLMGFTAVALFTQGVLKPFGKVVVKRWTFYCTQY